MKFVIIGIVVAAAVIISVFIFVWTVLDYKKQKEIIAGQNYRKTYGLFDDGQYSSSRKAIKQLQWKQQKNTGPEPGTFDKKLKFIDYFGENSQLVIEKRTIS